MNKLFPLLAFAAFALVACSEDKPAPSHSELCAQKTLTKECLVGRWYLEKVVRGESDSPDPNCNPDPKGRDLRLKANGEFSFEGGKWNIESNGTWKLNETGTSIEIECKSGDCTEGFDRGVNADIKIYGSAELRISANGYASFSQCKLSGTTKLTEVFGWQGAN